MFGLETKDMKTIDEIANICRGSSPRPISKYVTEDIDGVNWIKIGDVSEEDVYITKTAERITTEGAKKSRTVKPGDFILSNSMSFGRPYLVGINGCVHDGWLIISDYQDYLNPLFFYYELRSELVQRQFDGSANGSCVKNLNSDLVRKVKIHVPSMERQMKFVEFAQQSDKSKFIGFKSQFIEMFGNEKNKVRLDELCVHFGDGDWIESKDQSEEGIRLIQTGNVGNGEYKDKDDKARYISEETFTRLRCTEVFPGDILISRLPDPIGRACIVPEMPKSITAVDCTIVRLKPDVLSTFFVNFTKTPMYTMQIDSFTTGSTRKRVSRANLGSVMVPVPNLSRQEYFVTLAQQSDKSK